MSGKDYLASFVPTSRDLKQSGVKGMKWGVRRDRSTLRKEAAKRGESKPVVKKDAATPPKGNIQDNVESSSTRYARLDSQAKSGRASDMTEQDLKFYNARTDALAKINKLNEVKPGWLAETSKNVIQKTAQRQMQMVSDTLADKYIGKPIADALKTTVSKPSDDD